jgi:hypothetical protein
MNVHLEVRARTTKTMHFSIKSAIRRHPVLMISAAVNAMMLVVALLGLVVDTRQVLNMPAWSKTVKFGLSQALYTVTLICILEQIKVRPQLMRWIGHLTGAMLIIEIVIITGQTVRGVPSHFNNMTAFDAMLYRTMGIAIVLVWLSNIVAFVALLRERSSSLTLAWGLRLGLGVALVGMAAAFAMAAPNATQSAALEAGQDIGMLGSHNVDVMTDGETRMLPFLGWNMEGGDLRIAHFIGLHGAQIIPLFALWVIRAQRTSDQAGAAVVCMFAAGYLGIALITLWQALRNESIVAPSALTLAAAAICVIAMFSAATRAMSRAKVTLN